MDVVYCCDEGFLVQASVSITSLFESNQAAEKIRVFVLGNNLSNESRTKLKSIGEIYTVTGLVGQKRAYGGALRGFLRSVTVISMENFEESLMDLTGVRPGEERFALTALARIFAPKFLPQDVGRYLYLDSDTIIRRDLAGLFGMGLEGAVAGMALEPTIYREVREYLGLKDDEPYYNSGVILIDRSRWEDEDISLRCVEILKQKHGEFKFTDQDLLNLVLRGKTATLLPTFGFFSHYWYRSYTSLIRFAPWYALHMSAQSYNLALENPVIVHFAGAERPWYRGNHNPWEAEYDKYLALSPYAGTGKTAGHEREMFLYHIMNLVTAVAPGLRDRISGWYYREHISGKRSKKT